MLSIKREVAKTLLEKLDSGGITEEELDLLLALHLDVGQDWILRHIKNTGKYTDSYLDSRLLNAHKKYALFYSAL